ncbi:MAG TPA: glycosyltransferase [Candidatus Saccharimonadales bacterium]|nr:glycosyltransferase [Candidatus Saccharimonadales bacterium]
MRILMISDHADPLAKIGTKETGGQNVYVMNMASLLANLGIIVDVYTRWDRATKQEVVTAQPGLRVIRVKAGPKSYMPRDDFLQVTDEFTQNVKRRIQREKLRYDVIFTHYWFSGVIGLDLAQTYGLPLTHVYHSIGQIRFEVLQDVKPQDAHYSFFKTRDDWERRIAREATSIISTSPMERDDILRLFGVPSQKVDIIPVGVDTSQFRPYNTRAVRKKLGLPTGSPIVLYAGRLELRKGIETLIEAIRDLSEQWQDIALYVIGGGSTKSAKQLDKAELGRLQSLVRNYNITDRVHFLGARPQTQMAQYYAAADVCATPSYYEPFGIVPIEAMACGTPVVASRIGGMQFTVEDGVTGYLATPRCPIDLGAKLHLVLKNGKEQYAEAARHRILHHFAWPRIAGATAAHLSKLAGKRQPAKRKISHILIKPLVARKSNARHPS